MEGGGGLPPRRVTLWERITHRCPVAEVEEVRRQLGADLVDRSEALMQEIGSLREIYFDLHQQNQEVREQICRTKNTLPEHPSRTLLEQKIVLLLKAVKKSDSFHAKALLEPRRKEEAEVKRYILKKHFHDEERPGTGLITPRSAPSGYHTRPGTSCSDRSCGSCNSAPSDAMEIFEKQTVNMSTVARAVHEIRAAVRAEHKELMQDIEDLQLLLESEHEVATTEAKSPPALDTMRDYSAKLELTWLAEDLESRPCVAISSTSRKQRKAAARLDEAISFAAERLDYS